jgi:hypothetical protein
MTIVAADAAESAWVETNTDGLDPDADVGFWSMSPASAEQVTVQIRTVLDRAWEFIALAYKGRAFIALGYPNWDAYVDARFGDLRIAVPREHRAQVVAELAGVRMSCRAIAKVLGVGVATVHRELTRSSLSDASGTGANDACDVVVGRDGKEYPRTRRTELPAMACPTCGEDHPESSGDCPWDLFAQGLAPHPNGELMPDPSPAEEPIYGMPHRPDPDAAVADRENNATPPLRPEPDATPSDTVPAPAVLESLTGLLGQLEALMQEVSGLGDVVQAIEDLTRDCAPGCGDGALERRVRRIGDDLGAIAAGWVGHARHVGRVADLLWPSS